MGRAADYIYSVNLAGIDMEYRNKFLADPRGTLAERGFEFPEEVEIVLVMPEKNKFFILVPEFSETPEEFPANHPIFDEDDEGEAKP